MSYTYDRTASARGPVHGLVTTDIYNDMSDLAWSLAKALEEYDAVGVYAGGPAERDVEVPKKALKEMLRALQDVLREKIPDVFAAERDFVMKHGTPAEYVKKMRSEIFPR
jgi:Holliday junction resolvasome RuvABC endonuclease subunit